MHECEVCKGKGVIHKRLETYGIEFVPCPPCEYEERKAKRNAMLSRVNNASA